MPIKWQPFKDLENFNKMNPFGGDGGRGQQGGGWVPFFPGMPTAPTRKQNGPAVDIYQDKDNLYLEASLPGIKPENVELSVEDDILSIKGSVEEKTTLKESDYIHREVRRGSFQRVIKLPVEVKGDQATAEFSNGILKISFPKAEKITSKAKKIPIKTK